MNIFSKNNFSHLEDIFFPKIVWFESFSLFFETLVKNFGCETVKTFQTICFLPLTTDQKDFFTKKKLLLKNRFFFRKSFVAKNFSVPLKIKMHFNVGLWSSIVGFLSPTLRSDASSCDPFSEYWTVYRSSANQRWQEHQQQQQQKKIATSGNRACMKVKEAFLHSSKDPLRGFSASDLV